MAQLFFKKAGLVLMGLFLFATPIVVLAQDNQSGNSVYIGADEVVDGNVIKFGNVIDIAAPVNGDVVVFGNTITISGPVAGDVVAAGNMVRITGDVSGSIRVAGNTVEVDAVIEKNAWVAGGSVNFSENTSVGWDVYAASGSVSVKGDVDGNIVASGGNIIIAGDVGKNVTVMVDDKGEIVLYPDTAVAGTLTYTAKDESRLIIQEGATVNGAITRTERTYSAEGEKAFWGGLLLFKTISFFGLLVIGLLLITVAPKLMVRVSEMMTQRPGASIGWGVIFFFLTPIVVIFLLITIIGIPLGLVLIPLYLIALYVSKLIAGLVIGRWLFSRVTKGAYSGNLVLPLIIGLLLVVVIGTIPIIGWLVMLVAMWWGLGGIIQLKKEYSKELQ